MRALSPLAKIFDFGSSPRRADSLCSSKRCFLVGKAAQKTDFIILYFDEIYSDKENIKNE
jgi:hypothetical protein